MKHWLVAGICLCMMWPIWGFATEVSSVSITIKGSQGGVSEAQLAEAERLLGVQFPEDYRRFMLTYNGGRPKPGGFDIQWEDGQEAADDWRTSSFGWFFSVWDEPVENLLKENRQKGFYPEGTVAIAHDAGGNVILLGVDGEHKGHVLFWAREYAWDENEEPRIDNVGFLASSFDEFLNKKLR